MANYQGDLGNSDGVHWLTHYYFARTAFSVAWVTAAFTVAQHSPSVAAILLVVYPAWDADACASLSPKVIGEIIRGRIGFDGLLMSDDLGMHALKGDFGERAAGVIAAGCDVALHCSGDMGEMQACAAAVGPLSADGHRRLAAAMATVAGDADTQTFAELVGKRDALLAYA